MKQLFGFLVALVLGWLAFTAPAGAQDAAAMDELNRHLAAYLDGARKALGEDAEGGAACLMQNQKQWEREVRAPCRTDAGCLRRVTLERLAVLDALQPGASRITAFPLPRTPALIAALPPIDEAQDAAAAPFAVTGQLVHESEDIENMGLAIRSAAGRSTVLVPDMDIGSSPTHTALQSALRSAPKATYRAEGLLDPATGTFALNQCRFVYRLPDTRHKP